MRKYAIVSFVMSILVGFAVAEGQQEGGDGRLEIVMIAKQEGISWFDDMRVGVEEFSADYDDVNAYQIAPDEGDPAKQVQLMEDLIAKQVDAILIVPNDPIAMIPSVEKARKSGIIVVTHEAEELGKREVVDYDLEHAVNEDFGVTMFEALAKQMNYEGKYTGFVGALTQETHMQWFNAGRDHIRKNYPNMQMVTDQPFEDFNDENVSYPKVKEILQKYPDIKGLFGTTISSLTMIGTVLREKNIKNIATTGMGLPSVDGIFLEDGYIKYAQAWRPADAGYVTAFIAYKVLKGEEIKSGINLNKPGYESVNVKGKRIFGNAPLILTKETYKKYNF